jgi:hypothetical protein
VLSLPLPLTAGELHGRNLAGPELPPPAMALDPIASIVFFLGGSLLKLRAGL